jgi:hypothetical protein
MPGWVRYSLHLQDGTQIGDLEGPHHIEVEKACNAGRKVRAIVTEISKQKWTGHNTTPLPLIEIHATC